MHNVKLTNFLFTEGHLNSTRKHAVTFHGNDEHEDNKCRQSKYELEILIRDGWSVQN